MTPVSEAQNYTNLTATTTVSSNNGASPLNRSTS